MAQDLEKARREQAGKQREKDLPLVERGQEEDVLATLRKKPPAFEKPHPILPPQLKTEGRTAPTPPPLKPPSLRPELEAEVKKAPPLPPRPTQITPPPIPPRAGVSPGYSTLLGEPPVWLPGTGERPKIFERQDAGQPIPPSIPKKEDGMPKREPHLLPVEEEEVGAIKRVPPKPPAAAVPPQPPLKIKPLTLKEEVLPVEEEEASGEEAGPPIKTPEEILGLPPRPIRIPTGQEKVAPPKKPPIPRVPLPASVPLYKGRPSGPRFAIIILGITLFAFIFGGLVYWRLFLQEEEPPVIEVPLPPSPFVSAANEEIIELQEGQETFLVEQIRTFERSDYAPRSLSYLPIRKVKDGTFVKTVEFFDLLEISLPLTLLSSLQENMMLYLYTPGEEEALRCQNENISAFSCFSPRLGLILRIVPGKEEATKNTLEGLERDLLQKMRPLILGDPQYIGAGEWEVKSYNGFTISYPRSIDVHYVNLPISTTSLNYAVFQDFLVIATSKYSSYYALDQLVKTFGSGL